MMTATATLSLPSLLPQASVPMRSPRTSLILAERARQRRGERRQRRQGRARRAALFAAFDRRPFDSIRTHAAPCLLFAGSLPLLCVLRPSW
jgi:hypothetical protein